MSGQRETYVVAAHELVVLRDEETNVLVLEDGEDGGDVLRCRATHHRSVVFTEREETVAKGVQLLRDITCSGQGNDLSIHLHHTIPTTLLLK